MSKIFLSLALVFLFSPMGFAQTAADGPDVVAACDVEVEVPADGVENVEIDIADLLDPAPEQRVKECTTNQYQACQNQCEGHGRCYYLGPELICQCV